VGPAEGRVVRERPRCEEQGNDEDLVSLGAHLQPLSLVEIQAFAQGEILKRSRTTQ
jgi:hypothetical protein